MKKKFYADLAEWSATTGVAVVGALAGADFHSTHGRFLMVGAVLAVVAASLKTPPQFVEDIENEVPKAPSTA